MSVPFSETLLVSLGTDVNHDWEDTAMAYVDFHYVADCLPMLSFGNLKLPQARGNQGKTATDAAEVLISDQPSRAQKFYRRDAHCTRKWVAGSQAGKNHPRSNSHSAPFRFSLKNVPLASSEPAQPILIEVALPSM